MSRAASSPLVSSTQPSPRRRESMARLWRPRTRVLKKARGLDSRRRSALVRAGGRVTHSLCLTFQSLDFAATRIGRFDHDGGWVISPPLRVLMDAVVQNATESTIAHLDLRDRTTRQRARAFIGRYPLYQSRRSL